MATTMTKENKLINKVKRLTRRAGLPRWLHHYGPKKYEFWQHAIALLVKQECKLSYRRVVMLLNSLGIIVPSYSALAKAVIRIPVLIWQRLLAVTANAKVNIVAIDGTGMSRPLPSPYYIKRIDKPYPIDVGTKLSIAVDTRRKKILALRIRAKKAHDIKDAEYLARRLPKTPKKLVADTAYDSEKFYEFLWDRGILPVVKIRKNAKRGFVRKKVRRYFNKKVYNRRSIVESVFFSIKRKFGSSLSSIKFSAQRAEIYCRAIAHNIFCLVIGLFQQRLCLIVRFIYNYQIPYSKMVIIYEY